MIQLLTTDLVYDCIVNLDLGLPITRKMGRLYIGPTVEIIVFSNYMKIYPDQLGFEVLRIDDIFDLQDWLIEYFK